MKWIVMCAALTLAACSTGGATKSASVSPNLVKPADLPERHRAVLEAWKADGTAWSIERENVRDDPELARFVVDNLVIEMVQAFDRSRLAVTGQRAGPFERAQDELVLLSEHSTPVLVQFLAVRDGVVAFLAADTLTRIGARAVEPTLAVLDDTHTEARRRAAELLARLPHAGSDEVRVLETLAGKVEKDREWIVRAQSALALGLRGSKHEHKGFAMGVLVRALSDEDESVAQAAAKALADLGEVRAIARLDEALQSAAESGRPAVVDAIRAARGVLSRRP